MMRKIHWLICYPLEYTIVPSSSKHQIIRYPSSLKLENVDQDGEGIEAEIIVE